MYLAFAPSSPHQPLKHGVRRGVRNGFNGKSVSAQRGVASSTARSPNPLVLPSFLFPSPRSGPSSSGYKSVAHIQPLLQQPSFYVSSRSILYAVTRFVSWLFRVDVLTIPLVFLSLHHPSRRCKRAALQRYRYLPLCSTLLRASILRRVPRLPPYRRDVLGLNWAFSHGSRKVRSANSEIFEACTRAERSGSRAGPRALCR